MYAIPEREIETHLALPVDVEPIGIGEHSFIACCRPSDEQDRAALGNCPAVQRRIAGGGADLVLRGRLVAQQLLDRSGNFAAVLSQLLPLVGKVGKSDHRIADELGDGFGACSAQHGREARDVDIGEPLHTARRVRSRSR